MKGKYTIAGEMGRESTKIAKQGWDIGIQDRIGCEHGKRKLIGGKLSFGERL